MVTSIEENESKSEMVLKIETTKMKQNGKSPIILARKVKKTIKNLARKTRRDKECN